MTTGVRLVSALFTTSLFFLLSAQDLEVTPRCSDGYSWREDKEDCVDINECETIAEPCKGRLKCINHFGGYLCLVYSAVVSTSVPNQEAHPMPPSPLTEPPPPALAQLDCPMGSVFHNGACMDLDECATGSHNCVAPRECVNTLGSYMCRCSQGYRVFGSRCLDIDECLLGHCQHGCVNQDGSFSCQCSQGFSLKPNGRTCQDVDECLLPGSRCQFQCHNTEGSFRCTCPIGYQLHGNRHSCVDVDECAENVHNCTEEQTCFNLYGRHTCIDTLRCDDPYTKSSEDLCVCPNELPGCADMPYSIRRKHMEIVSRRRLPTDIFILQSRARYQGGYNSFRIRAGNAGGEFVLRQVNDYTAMLSLIRTLHGPQELVLDLEVISVHRAFHFHSSSLLRLHVFVSEGVR
uniref:EGF-containing fibulin-like extracellular matrix protein 2 isoform X2 n=1 Tax=Myxine glutinosa TaxID=7769 RepID=UPI00358EC0E0